MSQVPSQALVPPSPQSPSGLEERARPVPRYTSYPTAPHFNEGVTAETYGQWLSALPADASLSLYLHIPYCDRLCWFCGCHTKQVQRYEPIARYLEALTAEINAVAARLSGKGRVTAVHLGGGSPSSRNSRRMAWALAPPKPNELTPASAGFADLAKGTWS